MDQQGSVTIAIPGLRSADPAVRNAAARLIWERYFRDLLTLARKNLDKRIRLRTDRGGCNPEHVQELLPAPAAGRV